MIIIDEAFSKISSQEKEEFKDLKPSDKTDDGKSIIDTKIEEIINKYAESTVKEPLKDIITYSLKVAGADVKENKFLDLMDKIKFNVAANQVDKFQIIHTMYLDGKLSLDGEYLTRQSTYNVADEKEFAFVLNCFNILNDPSRLSSYFKNTDLISEKALYEGEDVNKALKPIGKKDDEGLDTISGVINSWARGGDNEISKEEPGKEGDSSSPSLNNGGYTIKSALLHIGAKEDELLSMLMSLVNELFENGKRSYKSKKRKSVYLNAIGTLNLGLKGVKSASQLEVIRQNHIADLSKAPKNLKVDGNVVFAIFKKFSGDIEKDLDSSNHINSFVIWSDILKKWLPYTPEKYSASKNYANILLNSKTVEVNSSPASIVDGALVALDTDTFSAYTNG